MATNIIPQYVYMVWRSQKRTFKLCNTPGSCKYDSDVKSFCPINIAGFLSGGKLLPSVLIVMSSSRPLSS